MYPKEPETCAQTTKITARGVAAVVHEDDGVAALKAEMLPGPHVAQQW